MTQEWEAFFDLSALEKGLASRAPVGNGEGIAKDLLSRIQDFYQTMKSQQRHQPDIYQPGGEWETHVERRMTHYAAFYERSTDKLAHLLGNFWRNELGVLVKQYASFDDLSGDQAARLRYAQLMAHDLMIWTNLSVGELSDVAIPEVGHPWGYLWNGTLIGSKALRYHILATQIRQITEDRKIPIVAEIGGGYAGMAYFLMRGSEPRKYIGFDLPETLVVAAYYLSSCAPHRRVYMHKGDRIDWDSILKEYDVILMPNWCIETLPPDSVDVFVNTFSLSEMPYAVIKKYLEEIAKSCRGYFLHNNMDRAGVVNEGHERTPASMYPFPPSAFKLLYKRFDLFQQKHSGRDGDYREFLYQRRQAC